MRKMDTGNSLIWLYDSPDRIKKLLDKNNCGLIVYHRHCWTDIDSVSISDLPSPSLVDSQLTAICGETDERTFPWNNKIPPNYISTVKNYKRQITDHQDKLNRQLRLKNWETASEEAYYILNACDSLRNVLKNCSNYLNNKQYNSWGKLKPQRGKKKN
jgi:hypothetical protein